MKFKISVLDFQYAMRTVKDVVPTSGPLADSVGVLIEAKGDRATFTAYNPEVLAKATVKVLSERDGSVVVDAAALYSAVSHFKPINSHNVGTGDILVSSAPSSRKLQITTKTRYATGSETPHKRVFALRNQEYFPEIPPLDKMLHSFELPARTLMDGIDSVSFALSSDAHQQVFTGILMELEANNLTLFATNGICLAEYTAPVEYSGEKVRIVLPHSFTSKISKSFFDEDMLHISMTRSIMFARTQNLVLGGTLMREDYPDYKAVIRQPEKFAFVDKHVLLDNLLNMNYEASSVEDFRVAFSLEDGCATLVCGNSVNGNIPGSCEEGKFAFDCNLQLFASSIRNLYGDQLKVGYINDVTPLHFLSTEKSPGGYTLNCVLVPLVRR